MRLLPHDLHPRQPVSSVVNADALLLHIQIDIHLVANRQSVVQQVLEYGVVVELARPPKLVL